MKKFLFAFVLSAFVLASCSSSSDGGPAELSLNSTDSYVMMGNTISITASGGSGQYSVDVDDDAVISAVLSTSSAGVVAITPLATGNAVLTVKDTETGVSKSANIYVTKRYISVSPSWMEAEVEIDESESGTEEQITAIKNAVVADMLANAFYAEDSFITITTDGSGGYEFYKFENLTDMRDGTYNDTGSVEFVKTSERGAILFTDKSDVEHVYIFNDDDTISASLFKALFYIDWDTVSELPVRSIVTRYAIWNTDVTSDYTADFPSVTSASLHIVSAFVSTVPHLSIVQ